MNNEEQVGILLGEPQIIPSDDRKSNENKAENIIKDSELNEEARKKQEELRKKEEEIRKKEEETRKKQEELRILQEKEERFKEYYKQREERREFKKRAKIIEEQQRRDALIWYQIPNYYTTFYFRKFVKNFLGYVIIAVVINIVYQKISSLF